MGNFYASGFWGMLILIGIVAICGIIQAICQFFMYIFPKIKSMCKCLKNKLITMCEYIFIYYFKIRDYINIPCNSKIINKNIIFKHPVIPFDSPV